MTVTIKDAGTKDWGFLSDMMYEAIYIPEDKPPKDELLNEPHLRRYNEGWGRKGDRALIAFLENGTPVGAAWYRLFSEDDKGYGFIDEQTPEIGIAVVDKARGKGIGPLLMEELGKVAQCDGYQALSLSVDPKNTSAVRLYEKMGFKKVEEDSGAMTMIYSLMKDDSDKI